MVTTDKRFVRTPIAHEALSVVVPICKTAPLDQQSLQDLIGYAKGLDRAYEILLVNGTGNPATTAEWAEERDGLRVITLEKEQGYGHALKAGLAAAQHPLVATFPATGACPAAELDKLFKPINDCDIVVGARKTVENQMSWLSQLVGNWWLDAPKTGFGWVAYLFYSLWLKDVSSPVCLYRRSNFERLPVQSQTEFAHIEILAKCNFVEKILDEVSIEWKDLPVPTETPQTPASAATNAADGASPPVEAQEDIGFQDDFWAVTWSPDFGPPPPRPATQDANKPETPIQPTVTVPSGDLGGSGGSGESKA